MKPYLVDVPVLLFVFIRPDTLEKVFEVIREARPSKLFLVSDGPRINNEADRKLIEESRTIVNNIDWECEVNRLYFDENQGMYNTFQKALEFVFNSVDRCIFLEDDVVTSKSFFKYCEVLLEKYKDDLRINSICGMNHMGVYDDVNDDYFFCKTGSIWGFALWKRTYELFYKFDYGQDEYYIKNIMNNSRKYHKFSKSVRGYLHEREYNGHLPGPEFFLGLNIYSQSQLTIVPKRNMVKNIGYGNGNTHFVDGLEKLPKAVQKMFNMSIHEYDFPLKHPKYIVEDKFYEKALYKIMGRPVLIKIARKVEMAIRLLVYNDKRTLFNKTKNLIKRKKIRTR